MSEVIKGKLEEIIVAKTGKGKRGPWTLYAVTIDGNRYGAGFTKPKAAVGDIVELEVEENEAGYTDLVKDTAIVVVQKATSEESAAVSKANAGKAGNAAGGSSTNQSIENQVTLKAAVDFAGGFGLNAGEALELVGKAYKQFSSLLRPTVAAAPAAAKKPAKPPVDEDENQDEIPY